MSAISECVLCGCDATGKAKVEGVVVDVCDRCSRFGQPIKNIEYKIRKRKISSSLDESVLAKDFHANVRHAREKKGLTQEELAKKLSEKHSVIKRLEEGWKPPMNLILKIEKFFGINLREDVVDMTVESELDSKKLTIGDVVDIK
ncbi:MAG: TIGR00270 family protein [Candidatus Aenigmarchaeota archaeon]|nr:TIGR00270 family protein [Candidatus Aenigmarchaeota archaeon]